MRRPSRKFVHSFLILIFAATLPAAAQPEPHITMHDVGWVYREAQFFVEFEANLESTGRLVMPRPLERHQTAADTLDLWIRKRAFDYKPPPEPEPPPPLIQTWKVISPGERLKNLHVFGTAEWAFLGNNEFTALDTSLTREIRARMQSRFGPPTVTMVEREYWLPLSREEYIQFEYWFELNDSIPMIVIDVNGPTDRGVIVAVYPEYRDVLYQLRESFLGGLIHSEPFAPYVDYYYNYVAKRWYRTGWDGEQFFIESMSAPNLARGRPKLTDR